MKKTGRNEKKYDMAETDDYIKMYRKETWKNKVKYLVSKKVFEELKETAKNEKKTNKLESSNTATAKSKAMLQNYPQI